MNKYIYLNNLNIVWEILDEFNSTFPGIPIQERYSKQFLNQCLVMSEKEFNQKNIFLGMIYNEETNTFYYPFTEDVEEKIIENKENEEDDNKKEDL